ncbi:acyltransferase family protein [Pseudobutyrivibrio sp.]|uniref:acyltransferase family protein n=1 Tax=Pseudobutyrivibrio sp. TaxID=2014367 RepID=UPI001DB4264E|nr:acyltransferase [Pseudobutyrivibrio sp.]MBE5910949.1 acyltransferase [Pseudobutyrivibrio sp.]
MTSTNIRSTRMPQFDLLRVVAILIIFNYHFCTEIGAEDSIFCGYKNGGWGSVGTCIFFILSGYMIQMTCKNVDIKKYIKKRFLSIFPPLWICFIIAYLITSISRSDFFWGGNILKLVLSFAGFDTYAVYFNILTYACVGEWFTGMIIFLYCAYLILRVLMRKAPIATTIVLTVLYFAEAMYAIQPVVPADASIFTALALFWLGMLFQEHPNWLGYGIIKTLFALIATGLVLFVPLPYVGNVLPWKNLLGIALFYLLINLFSAIPYGDKSRETLKYLSGISFIIYLAHHFVIIWMLKIMDGKIVGLAYIVSLMITVIVAAIISKICSHIK